MRELQGTLGGREITLAATFGASVEIAKKVGDPLMIAREANLEAMMINNGIPYTPKWNFNVENIPQILLIGMKAAGATAKISDVEELVFESGFPAARDLCVEYLALIVGPQPEEDADSEDGEGN